MRASGARALGGMFCNARVTQSQTLLTAGGTLYTQKLAQRRSEGPRNDPKWPHHNTSPPSTKFAPRHNKGPRRLWQVVKEAVTGKVPMRLFKLSEKFFLSNAFMASARSSKPQEWNGIGPAHGPAVRHDVQAFWKRFKYVRWIEGHHGKANRRFSPASRRPEQRAKHVLLAAVFMNGYIHWKCRALQFLTLRKPWRHFSRKREGFTSSRIFFWTVGRRNLLMLEAFKRLFGWKLKCFGLQWTGKTLANTFDFNGLVLNFGSNLTILQVSHGRGEGECF